MKITCPVCGRMGHLQVRGKSARIGHYISYDGKTRLVQWHKVDSKDSEMVNNGNQNMVIKNPKSSFFSEKWSLGRGLNPRPLPYQNTKDNFNQKWKDYLYTKYAPSTASAYYNNGKRYAHLLFNRDFSYLKQIRPDKRLHIIKALCCLSKFIGQYHFFKQLMKGYDLKWSYGNKDALILRRIFRPKNHDKEIIEWIQTVKQEIPLLSQYLDFHIITGLRKIESIRSFNLIKELGAKNKLDKYYSDGMLYHFRFPEQFLRPTKKAFFSFIPPKYVREVVESPKITVDIINKRLQRSHILLKFCDIREYWATSMTRYLSQPEIDFLQGRVGSIFMKHYFNPTLITDLKDRTFAGINNLMKTTNFNR